MSNFSLFLIALLGALGVIFASKRGLNMFRGWCGDRYGEVLICKERERDGTKLSANPVIRMPVAFRHMLLVFLSNTPVDALWR